MLAIKQYLSELRKIKWAHEELKKNNHIIINNNVLLNVADTVKNIITKNYDQS